MKTVKEKIKSPKVKKEKPKIMRNEKIVRLTGVQKLDKKRGGKTLKRGSSLRVGPFVPSDVLPSA